MGTRRGRNRKMGPREKNGRPQRHNAAEAKENAQQVALEARIRVFGVSKDDAIKQEAGSVIGRLRLAREISQYQYEAALKYEEIVRAANQAILSRSWPTPGDLNRSHGHDGSDGTDPEYVAKCARDTNVANRVWRALAETGQFCRWAVDQAVLENANVPGLVGDLRLGLNAICRALGMPMPMGQREAA